MQTRTLLAALLLFIVFASCKKDSQKGTTSNTWKFGTTTYNVSTTSRAGKMLVVSDAPGQETIYFSFTTFPPASGTYIIGGNVPGAPNEIGIDVAPGSDHYISFGYGTNTAVVTVANGKISINVPDTKFLRMPAGDDTTFFSASISE